MLNKLHMSTCTQQSAVALQIIDGSGAHLLTKQSLPSMQLSFNGLDIISSITDKPFALQVTKSMPPSAASPNTDLNPMPSWVV